MAIDYFAEAAKMGGTPVSSQASNSSGSGNINYAEEAIKMGGTPQYSDNNPYAHALKAMGGSQSFMPGANLPAPWEADNGSFAKSPVGGFLNDTGNAIHSGLDVMFHGLQEVGNAGAQTADLLGAKPMEGDIYNNPKGQNQPLNVGIVAKHALKGTGEVLGGGMQAGFAPQGAALNQLGAVGDVAKTVLSVPAHVTGAATEAIGSLLGVDTSTPDFQESFVQPMQNIVNAYLAANPDAITKPLSDTGEALGRQSAIDEAYKSGDINAIEQATSAPKPTITGNVGAGLYNAAGKVISKATQVAGKGVEVAKETAGTTIDDMGKARIQRIIDNRVNELTKLQENNAPLRKVISSAETKGIDVKGELAKTDLLKGAVDSDGTIRTAEAIDKLNEFIRPQEDVIGNNLRKEGKMVNLADVEERMKTDVKASGVKGGALVRALKNVESDIEGYKLEANKKGEIPVATLHDAKVDKYANIDYLNPETSKVDKIIAGSLKKLVEEKSDIDVKGLNKELSKYYAIQNLLEKLNGKKVAGGRLGKYFAQTVGAVAGSAAGGLLGPVRHMAGTFLGSEAGGFLKGLQMKNKFSGETGYELKPSEAMQKAIQTGKD